MNENVTIIDKNNNGILAEGIAYIKFPTNGKRYIIYTLNEIVKNDMKKIYVGEVGETAGVLDKIPDDEWSIIRDTLMPVTSGNPIEGVECLSMGTASFMIGIPKKLAVSDLAKQTLRSFYVEEMASKVDTTSNEPAVESTPQFFSPEAPSVVSEEEPAIPTPMVNIFDTPLTPNAEEQLPKEPTIMPQPAISSDEVKVIPSESTKEETESPKTSVTKEEALKALDVLMRYVKGKGETLEKTEKKEENLEIPESAISLIDELSLNDQPETASNTNSETPKFENNISAPDPSTIQSIPEMPVPLEIPALNESMPQNTNDINAIPSTQIIDMDALDDDFETIETKPTEQNAGYTANNNGAALQMGVETPSALGSQVVLPNNYMNPQTNPTNAVFGPGSLPTE